METNNVTSPFKTTLRLVGAIVIAVIGALVIGTVTGLLGSIFYFIFLFPLGMGLMAGQTVQWGVKLAKLRKINQVILLSVLVAVLTYSTFHYARYLIFRIQGFTALYSELEPIDGTDKLDAANIVIDYALRQETGHDGFFGYLIYKAQQGMSIGKFYSSNRLNLGFTLTWVYWMLEFGIILWITTSMGKSEARIPVCEICGSRIGREKHLGGTVSANEPLMLDLIQRREFAELGKLIEENADVPSTELYLKRCESCEKGNSYVAIRRAFRSNAGALQFTDILNVTLPPTDMLLLSQNLPNK